MSQYLSICWLRDTKQFSWPKQQIQSLVRPLIHFDRSLIENVSDIIVQVEHTTKYENKNEYDLIMFNIDEQSLKTLVTDIQFAWPWIIVDTNVTALMEQYQPQYQRVLVLPGIENIDEFYVFRRTYS